jgi:hypothetical protein
MISRIRDRAALSDGIQGPRNTRSSSYITGSD